MLLLATVGVAACSEGTFDPTAGTGDGDAPGSPSGGPPGDGSGDGDSGGEDGGGDGGATEYEVGTVLAELELDAPHQESFFLRGTFPVPVRLFPRLDGDMPFAIRDADGVETPAQVEVVSRYAKESNGADVVEVLSRVARPAGVQEGERVRYQVIWSPHAPESVGVATDVAELIDTPFAVKLRTRDVFGHRYAADPLRDLRNDSPEMRILRDGSVARQVRTHEVLMPTTPTSGPHGTLPHNLGVHSFVTVWDDAPLLSIDLRVHNGSDGEDDYSDRDDPLGDVYFREFELELPEGWRVARALDDPMAGEPYMEGGRVVWPIVLPMADGSMHFMPQQAQFHRRLVIARNDVAAAATELVEEGWLAFCRKGHNAQHEELFSWWNLETARYFPQKQPLPEMWDTGADNLRKDLENRFATYSEALRTGASGPWPINVPNFGWSHPWGLSIGYAHGGDEIFLYDGVRTAYAGSAHGYRYFQLVHRMMSERHPTTLFDNDGEAFKLEDWIAQGPDGPYLPVYIWTQPVLWLLDPFGFTSSPDFQRQAVTAMGLRPDYESQLRGFEAIDRAHLIRYTRSPKVLAWLGNDALAKDDLRMQAELQRAGYSLLPQNHNGDHIVTGLLADRLKVDSNPGQGAQVSREEGWTIDVVTAAYCVGDPTWRSRIRHFFYDVAALVEDGTSECTGMLMSDPNLDQFGGDYRARQSISAAILQNALWGVRESVFAGHDPAAFEQLSSNLRSDIYGMISDLVWNEEFNAPWFYVALGPYETDQPEYCEPPPADGFQQIDAYQVWSSFAYGYQLSLDPAFLQRAALTLGTTLTTPHLTSENYGLVENRSALIALVQELLE